MGKWNHRRRWTPKNYYRDQRLPSPPTYYETEFTLRGAWKNVGLPWEERYCISVGIPWEKVVTAKKYMYCHDNVVKWDDSASEATFHDAKNRFWENINGLPSDVPQPDPDMYIDEIDWNPDINPELVKDLDEAYFNPDETEKNEKFDNTKRKSDDLVPGSILGLDDKNPNPSNSHDPWECNINGNSNSSNKNISDPWEQGNTQNNKEITWGGGGSSSWQKDVTWGISANNSWHQKHYPVDDSSKNTWGRGGRTTNELGWKNNTNSQLRGAPKWHGNSWDLNASYRKREGSHQYTSSYKTARVQSDDYGGGNQWGRQRTHNRVSFARD